MQCTKLLRRFPLLLLMVAACESETGVVPPAESGARFLIELRQSTSTTDASPPGAATDLLITPHGEVVHFAALPSGKTLVITDSLGNAIGELGRRGSGPGEITVPLLVDISDSSVVAVDLASLRVTEWQRDGSLIRTLQLSQPILPRAQAAGHWVGLRASSSGFAPSLMRASDGGELAAPASASPLLDSLLAVAGQVQAPAIGIWDGGYLVGDGMSYRIGRFDSTGALVMRYGREVGINHRSAAQVASEVASWVTQRTASKGAPSPAEVSSREEKLRSEPIPWFTQSSPLQTDPANRLWVVGTSADSVFADVFDSAGAVERHWLDCPGFEGRWAVADGWLALVCAAPAGAEQAAVVRRFRVTARR